MVLKESKKDFSRIPIDLTLDQTVNADTASQNTGILLFTDPISLRVRWTDSNFIRMGFFQKLLRSLI